MPMEVLSCVFQLQLCLSILECLAKTLAEAPAKAIVETSAGNTLTLHMLLLVNSSIKTLQ